MKTIALVAVSLVAVAAEGFAPERAIAAAPLAPRPTEPTELEMAPIAVPLTHLEEDDFALRLSQTCEGLTEGALAAARAAHRKAVDANGVAARTRGRGAESAVLPDPDLAGNTLTLQSLTPLLVDRDAPQLTAPSTAGLKALALLSATCGRIKGGGALTNDDIASLREFRKGGAAASELVPRLLQQAEAAPQGRTSTEITSAGSLQSMIINGLAKFIYDRAKLEGITYLRTQLTNKLCGTSKADLPGLPKLLLPATCTVITTTEESVPLGAIGSYLATATRRDLEGLPDRILAYDLHMAGNDAGKANAREVMFGARLGLAYYHAVASGRTPLDVARSMHAIAIPMSTKDGNEIDAVVGYRTNVFKAMVRISDFADAIAAQKGWSTVKDPALLDARFFALGVTFSLDDSLKRDGVQMPALTGDTVTRQIPVVAECLTRLAKLFERAQKISDSLSASSSVASGDFSPGSPSAATGTPSRRDLVLVATQTFERIVRDGTALARALGADMDSATAQVGKVLGATELGETLVSHAPPSEFLLLASDVVTALDRKAGLDATSGAGRALHDTQHLLALVAQLAQAKSADEVAITLDAAAVPPTLYKQKYTRRMVTVGALAGASAGAEWVRATDSSWSGRGITGAFAPVGLAISAPVSEYFHLGGMVSVINLGSLVSARFSSDVRNDGTKQITVEPDPQVRLENVFSPGLFATLGLGASPFVFTFGGQVVPSARKVVTTDIASPATSSRTTAIEVVAALAIDVPLFDF